MGSDLGFESDGDAMVMEDGGLIVQVQEYPLGGDETENMVLSQS